MPECLCRGEKREKKIVQEEVPTARKTKSKKKKEKTPVPA
jgi:hypothetical protein